MTSFDVDHSLSVLMFAGSSRCLISGMQNACPVYSVTECYRGQDEDEPPRRRKLLTVLTGLADLGTIRTIWHNGTSSQFVEGVLPNEASSGCSESLEFQGGSEFDMDPGRIKMQSLQIVFT